MSVSLQTLKDVVFSIIREQESDVSSYDPDLVTLMINSAQQNICSGRVVDPLSWQEVRKGTLPFLNSEQRNSNVNTTSVSTAATVGATELDAVTTNYPATGTLYIQGDMVTYTGVTGTQFTGCTWISFARPTGTEVSIAFTLPTDFASPINVIYNKAFQLEAKSYDDIYEDMNDYKGSTYQRNSAWNTYATKGKPFYTIKDGSYLIVFNVNDTDALVRLRYEKIPTVMAAVDDTVTIDDDTFAKTTIPYLAAGEMFFNRWEEGRGWQLINFGIGKLKQMYTHYTNKDYQKISGTNYKIWKSVFNI